MATTPYRNEQSWGDTAKKRPFSIIVKPVVACAINDDSVFLIKTLLLIFLF